MPTIAIIDGVRIVIYPKEHLHAIYAEREAQISIRTGALLNGKLPAVKLRVIQAWLAANRPEVAYMWREIVERNGKGRRID